MAFNVRAKGLGQPSPFHLLEEFYSSTFILLSNLINGNHGRDKEFSRNNGAHSQKAVAG